MTRIQTARSNQKKILTPRYITRLKKWLLTQGSIKDAAGFLNVGINTIPNAIKDKKCAPRVYEKLLTVVPEEIENVNK